MNTPIEPPVSRYIRETWKGTVRVRTQDEGTHLGLPYPYNVPCVKDGFDTLFYWDTYFICRGLELQDFHQQVRWNCDNLLHLLDRFGFVPNASTSFLVKCSQPPYLGETIALVLKQSPDAAWRRRAAEALEREHGFWMQRRLLPCGLNHYGHHLADMIGEAGVPARLEQEFEWLLVGRMGMAAVADPAERRLLASHTLAEAESGWDFTPRFFRRATGIAAVDLNSILYRTEQILDGLWTDLGEPARASRWRAAAEERAALIRRLCWDEEQGCFADWDPDAGSCLKLVTAATFQPLWAGIATPEQARRTLAVAERQLLLPHGIVTCAANNSGLNYQWDYPNAWPPLQLIAWEACDRYGHEALGRRIAAAYAATVERNFEATGDLWEKYNACDGTIQVQDEYKMPAMLDWTAGAYLVARQRLDQGVKSPASQGSES